MNTAAVCIRNTMSGLMTLMTKVGGLTRIKDLA